MTFKVAVICYSVKSFLATLANVIAEGARQVPGAEVAVYRVKDPVKGDDSSLYDDGVLDADIATTQVVRDADAIILGAPGRQGGMCGEMRLFLDSLAPLQVERKGSSAGAMKGKVGSAFTSVGGHGRGWGGHEAILSSFHAFFLQHGMVVVGTPPTHMMEDAAMATPFGIVMAGKDSVQQPPSLTQQEVKLAFGMGEWTAQVAKLLHDLDMP